MLFITVTVVAHASHPSANFCVSVPFRCTQGNPLHQLAGLCESAPGHAPGRPTLGGHGFWRGPTSVQPRGGPPSSCHHEPSCVHSCVLTLPNPPPFFFSSSLCDTMRFIRQHLPSKTTHTRVLSLYNNFNHEHSTSFPPNRVPSFFSLEASFPFQKLFL